MIKWMMKIIMTIMIKRSYGMMGYSELGGMFLLLLLFSLKI